MYSEERSGLSLARRLRPWQLHRSRLSQVDLVSSLFLPGLAEIRSYRSERTLSSNIPPRVSSLQDLVLREQRERQRPPTFGMTLLRHLRVLLVGLEDHVKLASSAYPWLSFSVLGHFLRSIIRICC